MVSLKRIVASGVLVAALGAQATPARPVSSDASKNRGIVEYTEKTKGNCLTGVLLPEKGEKKEAYEARLSSINKYNEILRQDFMKRYQNQLKEATSSKQRDRILKSITRLERDMSPRLSLLSQEGQEKYIAAKKERARVQGKSYDASQDPNLLWVRSVGGKTYSGNGSQPAVKPKRTLGPRRPTYDF